MNAYCVRSCNPGCLHELKASEIFDELMSPPLMFLKENDAFKNAEDECKEYLDDPDFSDYTMEITHNKDGDVDYTVAEPGEHGDPMLLVRISKIELK